MMPEAAASPQPLTAMLWCLGLVCPWSLPLPSLNTGCSGTVWFLETPIINP